MNTKKILKGAALGAVGGLASTVVMGGFLSTVAKLDKKISGRRGSQFIGDEKPKSTGKVAHQVAKSVLHKNVSARNEKAAGLVHFAFGTGLGVLYGTFANRLPRYPLLKGLIFGAGVWLIADEIALPRLKLSRKAKEYTLATHAKALAGHLVYGVALEASQNILASKDKLDNLEANQLH